MSAKKIASMSDSAIESEVELIAAKEKDGTQTIADSKRLVALIEEQLRRVQQVYDRLEVKQECLREIRAEVLKKKR